MGLFDRFLDDVSRVAAALAPILGGALEGPDEDGITWRIADQRGARAAYVELNQMHGVFGVGCTLRELALDAIRLEDDRGFFATESQPYVAARLKASTAWDAPALWQLLPAHTRQTIVELPAPEGSSLTLSPGRLAALVGPVGVLHGEEVVAMILRDLDRLLALAPTIETAWDVDPRGVGTGRAAPLPATSPAPPPPVVPRDAAAVAARARPARDAMIARLGSAILEPFPTVNPWTERPSVEGRVVVLPPAAPGSWIDELGKKVLFAGGVSRGWYFARTNDEGFARLLRAVDRYERATGVKLGVLPYEIIGRLTGKPRMTVVYREARTGLDVAVLGALIGDRVFVDTTVVVDGESPFAGELD